MEKTPLDFSTRKYRIAANMLFFASLAFAAAKWGDFADLEIPRLHRPWWFFASTLCLGIGFSVSILAFHVHLRKAGYELRLRETAETLGTYIFAKYIPGKAAIHLGRALRFSAITARPASGFAFVSIQSQLLGVISGMIVGAGGMPVFIRSSNLGGLTVAVSLAVGFIGFCPSLNRPLRRVVSFISQGKIRLPEIPLSVVFSIAPLSLATWVFWGAGFYFLVGSLSIDAIPSAVVFCFPLSTTLGILSFLSPGGLGVREGFIVAFLRMSGLGIPFAVTVAAASRLWFLMGEMTMFIVAKCFWLQRSRRNSTK